MAKAKTTRAPARTTTRATPTEEPAEKISKEEAERRDAEALRAVRGGL